MRGTESKTNKKEYELQKAAEKTREWNREKKTRMKDWKNRTTQCHKESEKREEREKENTDERERKTKAERITEKRIFR